MSDVDEVSRVGLFRGALLGGALLALVLSGALVVRLFSREQQSLRNPAINASQSRPIVQIVRQQSGLPDVADLVERLCPSVAVIVPHGATPGLGNGGGPGASASVYSADGWLVTSASNLSSMPLDAVFGDGRRVSLTESRTDPVSGLAIVKADPNGSPVTFSDQAFPRVGQSGLILTTPAGSGCSAAPTMIGSDFVADGGSGVAYVRLRPAPDSWSAGMPVFGNDGRVMGIGVEGEPGALIPAPLAATVIDELIRKSLSASSAFGFRATDYTASLASRLGDVRSGAGVALVRDNSPADKAGLLAGDIITAVDDQPVSSASELNRLLDAATKKVRLNVQRRSGPIQFTISKGTSS